MNEYAIENIQRIDTDFGHTSKSVSQTGAAFRDIVKITEIGRC